MSDLLAGPDSDVPEIALIQMPFSVSAWPSLGLSLLKSSLVKAGFKSKVLYFNCLFARSLGEDAYSRISAGAPQNSDLFGEWIFSNSVFDSAASEDDRYLRDVLFGENRWHRKPLSKEELTQLADIGKTSRGLVNAFLQTCIEREPWERYKVVGFTSVFQQHLASLALAKRLKALYPHLTIVFGGANCEGEMGRATLDNFPFVDAVCTSEGDTVFPAFVTALREGALTTVSGMLTREEQAVDRAPTAPDIVDLNSLPFPDFDDYFEQSVAEGPPSSMPSRLLFETSRGCWWGQKNHCTFCGLNGQTMQFRYKSAERAVEELVYLLNKYGHHTSLVSATDNIIPHRYFATFLPQVVALGMNLDIFYETKANLRKEQLILYRQAGLKSIQPGIESLQSDVLRLMRKGVSALQNIQLLKWCKEMGIVAHWNYLFGFPGEEQESYRVASRLVKRVVHLEPPVAISRLRFDRFSPYVNNPERFSIINLHPYPAYQHVYPSIPSVQRDRLAYYFVGDVDGQQQIADYTASLRGEVARWKKDENHFMLAHLSGDGFTIVFDARGDEDALAFVLYDLYNDVFRRCDSIISVERLVEIFSASVYGRCDVLHVVSALTEVNLLAAENADCLSLSVPLGSAYTPDRRATAKLEGLYIQKKGDRRTDNLVVDISKARRMSMSDFPGGIHG